MISEQAYILPTGGYLIVEPEVLALLASHSQRHLASPEQGGILVGEYREGNHILLCGATKPGPKDRFTRTSFCRDAQHHQVLALLAWSASDCLRTYAGEWHTHPEFDPFPSAVDIRGWMNLPQSELPLILAIQGIGRTWWGARYGKPAKIVRIELCG